jgi:pimeloyl-ACP methyl ester carboxylesterase
VTIKRGGFVLGSDVLDTPFCTSLMSGAANVNVVAIDNARHFVVLDRPDEFVAVLDGFIAGLE